MSFGVSFIRIAERDSCVCCMAAQHRAYCMHKLLAGMLLRPWALLLVAHAGRRPIKRPHMLVTVHVYDSTSLSNTLPDTLY
jgi:hypothetical protein